MRVRTPLPVGAGALAGALGGALVGLVDGTRAALIFGIAGTAIVAAVALSVAVDALFGWVAGAVIEAVTRAALWGRQARAPLPARVFAFGVAGLLAVAAAASTIEATLVRHNRFLAAGLAALAAVAAAVPGALLAPAVARLVSARRAEREARWPGPALLLVAPVVAAAGGAVVFLALYRSPIPLGRIELARFVLRVSAPALLLPAALAGAAALRLRLPWRLAGPLGVAV
jgi:hypothetical protein